VITALEQRRRKGKRRRILTGSGSEKGKRNGSISKSKHR